MAMAFVTPNSNDNESGGQIAHEPDQPSRFPYGPQVLYWTKGICRSLLYFLPRHEYTTFWNTKYFSLVITSFYTIPAIYSRGDILNC